MHTSRGSRLFFFVLAPALFFLLNKPGWAQEKSDQDKMVLFSKTEPVYFSADKTVYERGTGLVRGEGNVEIVQAETTLEGDKVVINVPRQLAEIEGNVVATSRGTVVEGTRGIYDFATGEGEFYNARGFDEPWYVSAEEIDKEPTGAYTVRNASLTTCSGPNPHYRLKAGKVTVVPEERITARNLTLFAGPVPIFYFPYFSKGVGVGAPPINAEAGTQTGAGAFIRLGYEVEPTPGVALRPHIAAYTSAGVGVGMDGRLTLFDGAGRGSFDSFYIYDLSGQDAGEPGVDSNRGTAYLFYRQDLPDEWNAILRAEYNSDSEILKTFDFGKYEEREQPKSYFNLERTGLHNVVSFLTSVDLVNYVEDVERLPQLKLEALEQRIGDTGFFLSAGNESAYLNKEPEEYDSGRNFTEARLSYPLRIGKQLEVVPFLEADATYYSDTVDDSSEYRLSGSPGATLQTELQRVFGSPFPGYSAFRHILVPSVTYRFRPTPNETPEDLLQFDRIDRIDRENSVEIEVQNFLQGKNRNGERRELLQYTIAATMDLDSGKDTLAQLENELWIMPVPRWKLALESFNDFRDETRSDLLLAVLKYSNPDLFEASAGVVHGDSEFSPSNTQLIYSASKAFSPLWRAGFEQRYDFSESGFSFNEFWIWRSLDCLEAMLILRDRQEATSIMVLINITAFPLRQIERKTTIEPIEENRPWPTF